jgi:drug/metabolite transporter (DMT)-like permease
MLTKYLSTKSRVFKGFFYSVLGTLLVSTNFVTAKFSLYGFEPVAFGVVWTFAAAVHSAVIIALTKKTKIMIPPPPDRTGIILLGAATGIGMIWGWTALSMLDPSFNAFLARFVPVLTVIFGVIFLKEKITKKEITAIAVMLAGGVISAAGSWEIVSAGVFFAVLGFIMLAFQHIIAKKKVSSVHVSVIVFYRSIIAFFVILAWGLIRGGMDFGVPGRYWAVAALGALLGPCLSHILYYKSFSYWELSRSSLVSNIQPLFVMPLAYLFLRQLPDKTHTLGGLIILAGIFWLGWLHKNFRPQPET